MHRAKFYTSVCLAVLLLALTLSLAAQPSRSPSAGRVIPLPPLPGARHPRDRTPLQANMPRTIQIGGVTAGGTNCGIPTTAVGAALNFTVTQPQGPGHMAAWPSGSLPQTAAVNFGAGEDVGNAIDIGLGPGGTVIVQSIVATHLVVDVYGYFFDVEELGNNNTALGVGALASNTTGDGNTAVGSSALRSNTTGPVNTAVGSFTLQSNTTGDNNTAVGSSALAQNTTGAVNTAVGSGALSLNTTGDVNVAVGNGALQSNTTGDANAAVGSSALAQNTTGNNNTATGPGALQNNTTGIGNTAVGSFALNNTTGGNNTAIGQFAGFNVTTGSHNIHIGNQGAAADAALIRIGTVGTQTATFIAGIFGQISASGQAVFVNPDGRLGTIGSSRRVKDDIRDMDDASAGLGKLRPVTFRYKAEHDDGARLVQYGLIAEEVAEIYPDLVVRDTDDQPAGVRYHVLPAMLLNELQRQQRVIEAQTRLLDELTARLSRLEAKGTVAAGR